MCRLISLKVLLYRKNKNKNIALLILKYKGGETVLFSLETESKQHDPYLSVGPGWNPDPNNTLKSIKRALKLSTTLGYN